MQNNSTTRLKVCPICKQPFSSQTRSQKFCSPHCRDVSRIQPPEQRYWKYVKKHEVGCWEWSGTKTKRGYGILNSRRTLIYAHRISWEIHFGSIPENMVICHHCDNPPCTRPDHLFLGSQNSNIQDAVEKGRMHLWKKGDPATSYGMECHLAKLTDDLINEIRCSYQEGNITQTALAATYGVTVSTINRVVRRKTWKHIIDKTG